MKWYMNLKLKYKLTVGFAIMLLFICGVGATGYHSVFNINGNLKEIFAVRLPSIDLLLEADRDLHQLLVAERSLIFANVKSDLFKQLLDEYQSNLKQADERWAKYKSLAATEEEKALIKQYDEAHQQWVEVSTQIVQGRAADTREGRRLALDLTLGEAKKKFETMRDSLDKLTGLNLSIARAESQAADSTYSHTVIMLLSIIVLGMAVGAGLALFIGKSITNPVNGAVAGLKDIAEGEGDLTKRLEVRSKDEVGELSRWFNTFLDKLQDMVSQIMHNAQRVGQAAQGLTTVSDDMNTGSDSMSNRSNAVATAAEEMSVNISSVAAAMEQASTNMESVSSAAEEMNITITGIAKHTEEARVITNDAVQQTKNASVKVDQLGDAAKAISKVTEVITEISEQTNLLALNATIEAARAGEAGKGFAVVANEIKELARQTASATQEIKAKIEGIQGSTEDTVLQISQISTVIDQVNEIVSTIASATEEQSSATREIASNVAQASQGIQEVNQNVAQSSTASTDMAKDIAGINQEAADMSGRCTQVNGSALELNQAADLLNQLVGRFRV